MDGSRLPRLKVLALIVPFPVAGMLYDIFRYIYIYDVITNDWTIMMIISYH